MVKIKILHIENSKKPNGVVIRALMGQTEFKQLLGNLDNLCVFSTAAVNEPTSYTKTGARHSHAKYLLYPKKLRAKFKKEEFDFEKLSCGTVEYRDKLFVIYGVERKNVIPKQKE